MIVSFFGRSEGLQRRPAPLPTRTKLTHPVLSALDKTPPTLNITVLPCSRGRYFVKGDRTSSAPRTANGRGSDFKDRIRTRAPSLTARGPDDSESKLTSRACILTLEADQF